MADATPVTGSRWDATPGGGVSETPGHRWDATPGHTNGGDATPAWGAGGGAADKASRWDATPGGGVGATPTPRRNRWDDATPAKVSPG